MAHKRKTYTTGPTKYKPAAKRPKTTRGVLAKSKMKYRKSYK